MIDTELKEFNEFVQENLIRNKFLPIMEHLCKLTKEFTVDEFADKKTDETTCVQFHITIPQDEDVIDGRVGYDMFDYPTKKEVIYEVWWGGECYSLLHRPIEMMNMLSVLMGKAKIEGVSTCNVVRKSDHLFPIEV
jgi:hypothetical protein